MKKKIFNKIVMILAVLLGIIIITAGIIGRQILFVIILFSSQCPKRDCRNNEYPT